MQDMGQTCVCKGSTNAALRAHVNMQSIIPFHRRTMVSSRESCLVYKSKEESFCSLFVSCCILRKGDCVCFFRTIIDDRYHRVTMGVCVFLLECATAYKPPNATSLLKRQSTPLNFFLKCGAMELPRWGFHCGSIPPSFLETGYVDSNNSEASYAGACGLQRTQLKKPSAVLVVSRACFRALSVNPSPPPLVVSCVSPLLSQLCLQVQQSGAFLRGSEAVAAVLVVSPPLLRPPQSITSAAHFFLVCLLCFPQLCLQVQQSGAFLRGSEAVAAVLVVSPPLLRPPQSITSAAHFFLRVSFASSNYFCRCNKAAPFSMALRQELCRI